jgi:transcriptional regulator with XRE-family HTH domain
VDDQRVGRILRALRRRRGWRQSDLARRARCSQATVSRAERGHLPAVPILRRLLAALDASLALDVRWRAGALDRLLDEEHALLVGAVAALLSASGWSVRLEVTYSEFGERGSIDVVACWPALGILLVIEVKTDLAAVEAVLRKLDEKVRLAPKVVRERFNWEVKHVAWLLIMPESSTLRRRAARQATVLDRVFPARAAAIRTWIQRPTGPIAGLWFLSVSHGATDIRRRGGRERVRAPARPSGSPAGRQVVRT